MKRLLVAAALIATILPAGVATADELLQAHWRGRWVNYTERAGYAVIGRRHHYWQRRAGEGRHAGIASAIRQRRRGADVVPVTVKALTIDSDLGLWRKAPSASSRALHHRAGDNAAIAAALAEANRALAGIVRWVPRAAETDTLRSIWRRPVPDHVPAPWAAAAGGKPSSANQPVRPACCCTRWGMQWVCCTCSRTLIRRRSSRPG